MPQSIDYGFDHALVQEAIKVVRAISKIGDCAKVRVQNMPIYEKHAARLGVQNWQLVPKAGTNYKDVVPKDVLQRLNEILTPPENVLSNYDSRVLANLIGKKAVDNGDGSFTFREQTILGLRDVVAKLEKIFSNEIDYNEGAKEFYLDAEQLGFAKFLLGKHLVNEKTKMVWVREFVEKAREQAEDAVEAPKSEIQAVVTDKALYKPDMAAYKRREAARALFKVVGSEGVVVLSNHDIDWNQCMEDIGYSGDAKEEYLGLSSCSSDAFDSRSDISKEALLLIINNLLPPLELHAALGDVLSEESGFFVERAVPNFRCVTFFDRGSEDSSVRISFIKDDDSVGAIKSSLEKIGLSHVVEKATKGKSCKATKRLEVTDPQEISFLRFGLLRLGREPLPKLASLIEEFNITKDDVPNLDVLEQAQTQTQTQTRSNVKG